MENRTPSERCYSVGAIQKLLKGEIIRDTGAFHQKLRGREYTKRMGGLDPAWLARRKQLRVENLGLTSCERVAGLVLEGRN